MSGQVARRPLTCLIKSDAPMFGPVAKLESAIIGVYNQSQHFPACLWQHTRIDYFVSSASCHLVENTAEGKVKSELVYYRGCLPDRPLT